LGAGATTPAETHPQPRRMQDWLWRVVLASFSNCLLWRTAGRGERWHLAELDGEGDGG